MALEVTAFFRILVVPKLYSTMRKELVCAVILFALSAVGAFCKGRDLRFNRKGEFKIVQFTDLHYVYGKEASAAALENMRRVVKAEKPDLVVVTGDLVFSAPAGEGLREILECLGKTGVPFCTVFGNHDDEQDLTRAQMYDIISSAKGCVMPPRGGSESPDYALGVKSHSSDSTKAVIYLMDSNTYIMNDQGKPGGYGYIHDDQVEWYDSQSAAFTEANGGTPVPSVMFCHIPMLEYRYACRDESAALVGTRLEKVCCSWHKSGIFPAFKKNGDVLATFCGHDHDNDFAMQWEGILLSYGRYSGGNTVYNNLPAGGRVIVLKEGERSLVTYVREGNGKVLNFLHFPKDFTKTDWRTRQ